LKNKNIKIKKGSPLGFPFFNTPSPFFISIHFSPIYKKIENLFFKVNHFTQTNQNKRN